MLAHGISRTSLKTEFVSKNSVKNLNHHICSSGTGFLSSNLSADIGRDDVGRLISVKFSGEFSRTVSQIDLEIRGVTRIEGEKKQSVFQNHFVLLLISIEGLVIDVS